MFLSSADCFQNQHFWKILSGILSSKGQTVWIQIRPNVLPFLIWGSKLFAKVISRRRYIVGKGLSRFERKVAVSDNKVSKGAKIRNRYNQVPHLTQDTNGQVTNSQ